MTDEWVPTMEEARSPAPGQPRWLGPWYQLTRGDSSWSRRGILVEVIWFWRTKRLGVFHKDWGGFPTFEIGDLHPDDVLRDFGWSPIVSWPGPPKPVQAITAPLPCPFCGGQPEIERRGTGRQSNIACCTDCGCRLESPDTIDPWGSWNRRR